LWARGLCSGGREADGQARDWPLLLTADLSGAAALRSATLAGAAGRGLARRRLAATRAVGRRPCAIDGTLAAIEGIVRGVHTTTSAALAAGATRSVARGGRIDPAVSWLAAGAARAPAAHAAGRGVGAASSSHGPACASPRASESASCAAATAEGLGVPRGQGLARSAACRPEGERRDAAHADQQSGFQHRQPPRNLSRLAPARLHGSVQFVAR
jgi:hypothetical protein